MEHFFDIDENIINCKSLEEVIAKQKVVIQCLKSVINELPGSIYWKDKNGIYLGHNAFSTEKMKAVGLDWQSIIGKTDYDLFSKEVAGQYREHDLEVMRTGCISTKEETLILTTGETLTQLSYKRPLLNEQGEVIGIIGNTVDITYLKKIEAELRDAKEKSEEANQSKNELIRHMEHDIRTPFNGILVLACLLESKERDKEKRQCLQDISRSAQELLNYCNDMLEFIKTEANMVPVVEKKFDFKKLIESIISIEMAAARSKNLKLIFDFSEEVPDVVIGDPNRIQRILLNLVSNGIKFTKVGHIKISIKLAKKVDGRKIIIYLMVEDTGIGIAAEKQAYIYERFNNSVSQEFASYKGYGLGLPMVKLLIRELAGEIDLKSELGKGSKFICTLQLGIPLIANMEHMDL